MYLTQGIFIIPLIFSMCLVAHGWWDEVHVIIGEIAKSQMDEKDIAKIESYLDRWEYNYPQFGSISNASTWPDHVRCGAPPAVICTALPFQDNMGFFNGWHYNDMPRVAESYENKETAGLPDTYNWTTTGANFALNECMDFFYFADENTCTDADCPLQPGYDFSWNFALRIFLHVYGDLHNPCHCGYGINQYIPQGDEGCNAINMGGDLNGNNLHQITDSIVDTIITFMPDVDPEKAKENAKAYMEKYPFNEETFGEEFSQDPFKIDEISHESHKFHGELYSHFDFDNYNPETDFVEFDQTSREAVQTMLEKRFVLSGYRMAKVLTFVAKAYPDKDMSKLPQMTEIENICPDAPATPTPATPTPVTPTPATPTPATPTPATPPTTEEEPEEPEETCNCGADVVGIVTLVFSIITTAMAGYIIFSRGGSIQMKA